jgi:hypothetical protein
LRNGIGYSLNPIQYGVGGYLQYPAYASEPNAPGDQGRDRFIGCSATSPVRIFFLLILFTPYTVIALHAASLPARKTAMLRAIFAIHIKTAILK